ncbi:hypothetical protein FSO04_30815 [Paraburkholderia madseniana]|uniref:Uncharacterized protein n=1 Tax=Paraburkholderia madseniana TaxID=2599607 RepID=A0A6N6W881_9BURK|nr:hypothetical protein [Paraburkholderia madseniana]KAE8756098.1 hypothetical protein FSO04_30815 [Paraburkholderia madseniana]
MIQIWADYLDKRAAGAIATPIPNVAWVHAESQVICTIQKMKNILFTFLLPYISTSLGAAYNIQQALDGLGLHSINFVERDPQGGIVTSYWSAQEATMPIFGLLIVGTVCIACWTILSGYVVARKRGAVYASALIVVPGALSLASLWPELSPVPERYYAESAGVYGSTIGTVTLVIEGMLLGWSTSILLVDICRFRKNFWHLYDHVWTALGLLAAIFFVVDAQTNEHIAEWRASSSTSQTASAYLLKQTMAYKAWCRESGHDNTLSCQWASDVQQMLLEYTTDIPVIFEAFGPKSSADLYKGNGRQFDAQDILTIRREIAAYNRVICPIQDLGKGVQKLAPTSERCQMTPPMFCTAYPDPIDGKINHDEMLATMAISSECIIPALVDFRNTQERLNKQVSSDTRGKTYRWLYYLIFSALVGAKIAGSTVKLVEMDDREDSETRRGFYALRKLAVLPLQFIRYMWRWICACFGLMHRLASILIHSLRWLSTRMYRVFATRRTIKSEIGEQSRKRDSE